MSDTFDRILADKRDHIASAKRAVPIADIDARAAAADPPRGFKAALDRARAEGRYGLIAEIKKASPSRGVIRHEFDPPALARAYSTGGAACLSVLTDMPYFQGNDAFLVAARAAVSLPVLRKDFMIDPYQVIEARGLGADCILLIMAALGDSQATELEAAAIALGIDVLVEVHDRGELDRALRLKSRLIGINNRNLKTLAVDIATAIEFAAGLPDDVLVVAESGLSTHADLVRAAGHGITTFLVGDALMRAPDLTAATRALLGLAA